MNLCCSSVEILLCFSFALHCYAFFSKSFLFKIPIPRGSPVCGLWSFWMCTVYSVPIQVNQIPIKTAIGSAHLIQCNCIGSGCICICIWNLSLFNSVCIICWEFHFWSDTVYLWMLLLSLFHDFLFYFFFWLYLFCFVVVYFLFVFTPFISLEFVSSIVRNFYLYILYPWMRWTAKRPNGQTIVLLLYFIFYLISPWPSSSSCCRFGVYVVFFFSFRSHFQVQSTFLGSWLTSNG